jgi:osmoprotectant transport system ATP-binding protein
MIEIAGLTKRFGAVAAVEDVSMTVGDGEILMLVGGSGSGKTTTLKMVNRLIEPTAGRVAIDGADVHAIEKHELRRRIGYVFQKIGLFPHMTVGENVAVTLTLLGWPAARIRARVDELLALMELPDAYRDRRPSELSGGEQQRVGVARALAASPRVMLLDEPFGALDPLTRDRLQIAFTRIRRQLGLTGIFVTHDMAEALLLGDRIAVMRGGRLVQVGTPSDLVRHPADEYVRGLTEMPLRQAQGVDALRA